MRDVGRMIRKRCLLTFCAIDALVVFVASGKQGAPSLIISIPVYVVENTAESDACNSRISVKHTPIDVAGLSLRIRSTQFRLRSSRPSMDFAQRTGVCPWPRSARFALNQITGAVESCVRQCLTILNNVPGRPVQFLRDLQKHYAKRSGLSIDTTSARLGTNLLLVALLEVCVASVGTVYANGVLERFSGDGYLDIALAVVAAASVICVGVSLSALWRTRRERAGLRKRVYLALVTHGALSIPGLALIGQFLRA
jgi:hypothetical protein